MIVEVHERLNVSVWITGMQRSHVTEEELLGLEDRLGAVDDHVMAQVRNILDMSLAQAPRSTKGTAPGHAKTWLVGQAQRAHSLLIDSDAAIDQSFTLIVEGLEVDILDRDQGVFLIEVVMWIELNQSILLFLIPLDLCTPCWIASTIELLRQCCEQSVRILVELEDIRARLHLGAYPNALHGDVR